MSRRKTNALRGRRGLFRLRPWVLLLVALLGACGGRSPKRSANQAEASKAAPSPRPKLHVQVDGTGTPGQAAPIEVEGNEPGTRLVIRRVRKPLAFLEARLGKDSETAAHTFVPGSVEAKPVYAGPVPAKGKTPSLSSGLYLVTASRGRLASTALLHVTDLAIVVRRSAREILAFVADSSSGRPSSGVAVVLSDGSHRVSGSADTTGGFRTAISWKSEVLVFAGSGERYAAAVVPAPREGAVESPGALVLGRDVYASGETVSVRGIFRGSSVEARYRCVDADGRVIAQGRFTGPSRGGIGGTFHLPSASAAGKARLTVSLGGERLSRTFSIVHPASNPFSASIGLCSFAPIAGRSVRLLVRAAFRSGVPLVGGDVRYRVLDPGGRETAKGTKRLEGDGKVVVEFTTKSTGTYRVLARVVGPAGGERSVRTSFTVEPSGVALSLKPDRTAYLPGDRAEVLLRARAPSSARTSLDVVVSGMGVKKRVRVDVGSKAPERLTYRVTAAGSYEISARTKGMGGREVLATTTLQVLSPSAERPAGGGVLVLPDRGRYEPGAEAHVAVVLPMELTGATLLAVVEGRGLGPHTIAAADATFHRFSFTVPEKLGGRIRFVVDAVRDGSVYEGEATTRVVSAGELEVNARPRGPLVAGRRGSLDLSVTEAGGRPASAAVSLSVWGPVELTAGDARPVLGASPANGSSSGGVTSRASLPVRYAAAGRSSTAKSESSPPATVVPSGRIRYSFFEPHLRLASRRRSYHVSFPPPPECGDYVLEVTAGSPDGRLGVRRRILHVTAGPEISIAAPDHASVGDVLIPRVFVRNPTAIPVSGDLAFSTIGFGTNRSLNFEKTLPGGGLGRFATRLTVSRGSWTSTSALFTTKDGRIASARRGVRIEPPRRRDGVGATGPVSAGTTTFALDLPADAERGSARLRVLITATPGGAALAALPGLSRSVPGTMESLLDGLTPPLALARALREGGAGMPGALTGSARRARERVLALQARQHTDGGFGRWKEDPSRAGTTEEALEALAMARRQGLPVDEAAVARATERVRKYLESSATPSERAAALRALCAVGTSGRLVSRVRALASKASLTAPTLADLTLACESIGEKEEARKLAARLADVLQKSSWKTGHSGTGSTVPAAARSLRALVGAGVGETEGLIQRIEGWILDERRGAYWASPRSTREAVLALASLAVRGTEVASSEASIRIRVGDAILTSARLPQAEGPARPVDVSADSRYLSPGPNQVTIEESGASGLRYSAALSWRRTGGGATKVGKGPSGLSVRRTITLLDRSGKRFVTAPLKGATAPGRLLLVTITVHGDPGHGPLAVRCPVAGGASVLQPPAGFPGPTLDLPRGVHEDVSRGSVAFLLPGDASAPTRLRFLCLATSEGTFSFPAAVAFYLSLPEKPATSAPSRLVVEGS